MTTSPPTLHTRAARFAAYLRSLAQRDERGALAELRSGLGRLPGEATRVHRHIVPYLGETRDWSDQWFYLIGSLFPLYPVAIPEGERRTLGGTFARVRGALSESAEARFLALLSADRADLPHLLRGAISFLASRGDGVGVDWTRLLLDLAAWEHPDRYVQARWARDFYATNNTETTDTSEGELA